MASFFDMKARRAQAAQNSANAIPTSSKKSKDPNRPVPWVEKYRPKALSEVTAQDHTVDVLKRTLQSSNLPHMLFYGPPGTGKTSTVLALAKELYGPELMKTRVLELNASDERGISIVREKVKNFARINVSQPTPEQRRLYPCPPYKIIILDEADSMTQDAQSALRRTMETYSRITRFCLICNFVTRIIDPLASRCSKFRFKPLEEGSAMERLRDIAETEGVKYDKGVLEKLIMVSEGDLRKAITYLQSATRLHAAVEVVEKRDVDEDEEMKDVEEEVKKDIIPATPITVRSIEEIAGVIPEDTMDELFEACQPKPGHASIYPGLERVVKELVADGWSAGQVINQLYQKILFDDEIASKHKNEIVLIFSEVDKRLADGSDEQLQILDLCLRIGLTLAKP